MTLATTALDPKTVSLLLRYEPGTGKLFWRRRGPEWFLNGKDHGWNARYAGKEAFSTVRPDGYLFGRVLDVQILSHRVVWALCRGEWAEEIDHINGARADNRIENLRNVTRWDNMKNQKRSAKNTSGCTGVVRHSAADKWVAQIQVAGKMQYLGYFSDKFDAVLARLAAERQYGFHPNHGRAVA